MFRNKILLFNQAFDSNCLAVKIKEIWRIDIGIIIIIIVIIQAIKYDVHIIEFESIRNELHGNIIVAIQLY